MNTFDPDTISLDERENITNWINELQSGNHVQGRGALCRDNGAECCLGVYGLTHAGGEKVKLSESVGKVYYHCIHFGTALSTHYLPGNIWVDHFPALSRSYQQDDFSSWNDHSRLSFAEIAWILEEFLAGRVYPPREAMTEARRAVVTCNG